MGGGGIYNIFEYTDKIPEDVYSTLYTLNTAIFPGLSVGYMINDKIGLALFGDFNQFIGNEINY